MNGEFAGTLKEAQMSNGTEPFLWTQNENVISNPSGEAKVLVTDRRLARVICHLINSSPCWKLESTDENMDFRGIPR